jgi:flagellar basal body-associated protein FliL
MAIILALVIAVAAAAFVAAPLFFGAGRTVRPAGDRQPSWELEELLAEKETVYAAIQELDFDLKSGKLSAEDHHGLRQRYEERAAVILKAVDDLQGVTGSPDATRKTRREKRRG